MTPSHRGFAAAIMSAVLVTGLTACAQDPDESDSFRLEEASIASIHAAFDNGSLTCEQLVDQYLDRIETYDQSTDRGPAINAVKVTNPDAMREAVDLDRAHEQSGLTGAMHCIPVLVKDQVETEQMPTTYGSAIFEGHETGRDATLVSRMRDEGAIILGKTNMGEFAWGYAGSGFGISRNVYDRTKSPGASSAGTGASIAANFAAVGIAEDTGGSTRGPAAWGNAVGLRPTTPLISRYGTMPAAPTFDTFGPLTRTVEDAAKLTNVIAGPDTNDPMTAAAEGKVAVDYAASLDPTDLEGKRIGVPSVAFNTEDVDIHAADYARVEEVMAAAYDDLRRLGAEVVEIDTTAVPDQLSQVVLDYETEQSTDDYLAQLPNSPVATYAEMADSTLPLPFRQPLLRDAVGMGDDTEGHAKSEGAREQLRSMIGDLMNQLNLDAIAYPTMQHEPIDIAEDIMTNPEANNSAPSGSNSWLAPAIGYPALAVPAGFTSVGMPVGLELLGKPWSEELLFEMGYAYEQGTHHREAPKLDQ